MQPKLNIARANLPTLTRARIRRLSQTAFFALFVLAPPLDLFRLDLTLGHFIFLGQDWTLGLDPFIAGQISGAQAALNLFLRGFLPLAGLLLLFGWTARRFGRLYCGWLCPHFAAVEFINRLMRRASARPTLWEKKPSPTSDASGRPLPVQKHIWWLTAIVVLCLAFLWALILLTYLLPPATIYTHLIHGELSRNQTLFLVTASLVFSAEFLLARHLFCRYGCAVGLLQSFFWMANKRAMVVGFDRQHANRCRACPAHCEAACPMRLKPRQYKRAMFTCTQCAQCLDACKQVQGTQPPLLQWIDAACAEYESPCLGATPLRTPQVCFNPQESQETLWKSGSGKSGIAP